MRSIVVLLMLPLVLGACANSGLRDLRTTAKGPDEFMIQPSKPLAQPESYTTLPLPTPGQANLTDRNAVAEGVVAFGGQPQTDTGSIPASESALVRQASRFGVTQGIRQELAQSDAAFRKGKARFTQIRIVPVDRYNQAYRRQALDAVAEARRWRRAGARTPSAPPSN